jgi:F-type H+-transporting ATPase subunit b
MLINWFTVVAQIVNFLVLVALLKRFLWGRLVAAIDAREKHIAGRLAEAEEKNKGAEKLKEQARSEEVALGDKHDQIIRQAQREAEDERNAMIQRARDEVRGLEARWHEDLEREQSAFLNHLKRRAATEMLSVIRRALNDLACSDVQECATRTFLDKIKKLDAAALRDLIGKELTVLSALEIPGPVQHEIQAALEARLGAPVPLQFQRAPAMAWGIELRGNGRRIGWTPDSYIESLEENLKEALERRADLVTR